MPNVPESRPNRSYCSELAKRADAPLFGTAVQVDSWLLIEYPRPWKPKAVQDNDFVPAVNAHLAQLPAAVAALDGGKLRVQFIKQAASADMHHPRVMLSSAHGLRSRTLANYQGLLELTAAGIAQGSLGATEAVISEAVYLVCTNGQRDVCCARFGLPLYEVLRAEFGQRIWQTTHIGGHRYAPNLLSLPAGVVYGFVDPEHALALVARHDAGRLSLPHLRGRSSFPPGAQAAEYYLRHARGDTNLAGLQLQQSQSSADMTADMTCTTNTFILGDKTTVDVVVGQRAGNLVVASCEGQPKPVVEFELISISD